MILAIIYLPQSAQTFSYASAFSNVLYTVSIVLYGTLLNFLHKYTPLPTSAILIYFPIFYKWLVFVEYKKSSLLFPSFHCFHYYLLYVYLDNHISVSINLQ